ncbi:hypothetical protein JXJ21_07750 [candidate division KSB1 bacterium]|nr:hypothetical protein [candidate division KSB1 bacterium]
MRISLYCWMSTLLICMGLICPKSYSQMPENFTPIPAKAVQPAATISPDSGGYILWDKTHGVYAGYDPSNYFSEFTTTIKNLGYSIYTTTDFGAADLSPFDILVVCVGSAWDSAYTSGEAEKIWRFVDSGGGLLIIGDNPYCPNANINPVARNSG